MGKGALAPCLPSTDRASWGGHAVALSTLRPGRSGARRLAWGAMGRQASNEERRSEILFSRADRRAVRPCCW